MKKEQQDRSPAVQVANQSDLTLRMAQLQKLVGLEQKARREAEESVAEMRAEVEAQALVVVALEERLDAAGREQVEGEKQRGDLEERLTLALQELAEERSRRSQVQQRLAAALGTQGSSKEELLEDHAQLKKALAEASQRLDWKEQERSRLEFQLTEARKLLTQVKGGEAGSALLSERLTEARRRVSSLETENERAEERARRLGREQADLREQLERNARLWGEREQGLQEEIERLQADLSGGKFQEQQSRLKALERKLSSLKKALAEKEGESDQMARERRRLEDLLKDKRNELESIQQRVAKLEVKLSASESRRKDVEKEADRTRASYKALQTELEQSRNQDEARRGAKSAKKPGLTLQRTGATGLVAVLAGLLVGGGLVFTVLHLLLERSGQAGAIALVQNSFSLGAKMPSTPVPAVAQVASRPKEPRAEKSEPAEAPDQAATSNGTEPESIEAPVVVPVPKPVVPVSSGLTDSLRSGEKGPEMVGIPGGRFMMGSERDMLAIDERPAHLVEVSSFYMSRHEITFAEYDRFARNARRPLPDDRGWGRGTLPVIHVSWKDAQDYTRWLSRQTGKTYRLPSEAEWEYAARAGTDASFWWGYQVGSNNANCFDCGSSWDFRSTAPVGSFQANPLGLHDTAGNVQEWVADCYHSTYEGAPTDGSAWISGNCSERVTRGGAFDKPAERMQVSRRSMLKPELRLGGLGFRVVREP